MKRGIYIFAAICLLLAAPADMTARAQAQLTPQQRTDLDRVNTYLNRLDQLQAEFLQVAPDGAISRGNFYLSRPGRLRFEYLPPDDMLIIADGTWVAVREDDEAPVDRVPIDATPLSLLLDKDVDVGNKTEIIELRRDTGVLRITLRDPDAPQKGEITLTFADQRDTLSEASASDLQLRQWVVVDAHGLATHIGLNDLREGDALDPRLFIMRDPLPPSLRTR